MDNALLRALDIPQQIKYKNGLLSPWAMHVYIYLNQMMNDTTILPLQTHYIYPVVKKDLAIHYHPSMYLYQIFPM